MAEGEGGRQDTARVWDGKTTNGVEVSGALKSQVLIAKTDASSPAVFVAAL